MKFSNNKILKNFVLVLLVLVFTFGAWSFYKKASKGSGYHAVYMTSGDIYFGKLQRFPNFALSNTYTLQRNQGNTQTPFNLVKFDDVFWGPEDVLELNPKNILWMVELEKDSQVVQYIANGILPAQK